MAGAGSLSILHVLLSGGFGGAERHCLDLLNRQAKAGHRTSLLVRPRKAGEPASAHEYAPQGTPIFEVSKPWDVVGVWRAARKVGPDIVHCHLGWSARATGRTPGRPPAVVTLHRHYRDKECGRLDGVIRIADWQAETMTSFKGLSTTVHNWLPDLGEPATEAVAAARRQAGAGDKDILVGYVGRLHIGKGVDLLIEAFKRTAPANARLAIVGDGAERAALEAQAGGDSRITFVGFANPAAWYRAFDLFAMPSRHEAFGLVGLEAMVAGAPVIASDADGPREVFAGTPAVLTKAGDQDELIHAMADFFAGNKKRPKRIIYDLSRFDPERGLARIEDFYRQVIARRAAA